MEENSRLDRSIEDLILGYRNSANNRIVPGVLERLDRLEQANSWYQRLTFLIVLVNFLGIHSIRDVVQLFSQIPH